MPSSRFIFPAALATILTTVPVFALVEYPLSESASRSAYFLGQRHDLAMGEFLARYSKHLSPPKSGPYVSEVQLLTPYAQLVSYSGQQSMYSAQQAELDGRTKFSSIEITVSISLTQSYGPYLSTPPPTRSSGAGIWWRSDSFWREFGVRIFDGHDLLQPQSFHGKPVYLCGEDGCILTGASIRLSLPANAFASYSATVEVTAPDGQLITVDFDLARMP